MPVTPVVSTPAPPPTSSFAKIASEFLTPDMSDVEKLQKLKEWILADQHPFFTSAPKVAHLLSLRDPTSGSTTSGSAGDYDRGSAPNRTGINNIPLAERLSSPNANANSDNPGFHSPSNSGFMRPEVPPFRRDSQGHDDDAMIMDYPGRDDDGERADTRRFETTGPTLNFGHSQPRTNHLSQGYQRQPDLQRRDERPDFDEGRRSPKGDSRSWNKWDDGRQGMSEQSYRYPPESNGRYGDGGPGARYGPGSYRGSYNHRGIRRYSLNDRQHPDQRYDRRPDFAPIYPGDRHNSKPPLGSPRGPSYYNAKQSYDRRVEEQTGDNSPQKDPQVLATEPGENTNPEQEVNGAAKEVEGGAHASTVDMSVSADIKPDPTPESLVSPGPGVPPSTVESALPVSVSPERMEDSHSIKEQDDKSNINRSPPPHVDNRDGRSREFNRDSRSNYGNRFPQDNRPRTNAYQKPFPNRNYERPLPPRNDRTYVPREPLNREPYYGRPMPPSPSPVDDRRFVPRDAGYMDDPGYPPRRDYRVDDWDAKRDMRPIDRPYDRERDRDLRAPVSLPPTSDPRGSNLPPHAGPRPRYPPERNPPRAVGNARPMHDSYPMPPPSEPREIRSYDRDPYGEPPLPPAAAYAREPSRVRHRSASPPRRDYRQDDRPPLKRLRGPEGSYPPGPNGEFAIHAA